MQELSGATKLLQVLRDGQAKRAAPGRRKKRRKKGGREGWPSGDKVSSARPWAPQLFLKAVPALCSQGLGHGGWRGGEAAPPGTRAKVGWIFSCHGTRCSCEPEVQYLPTYLQYLLDGFHGMVVSSQLSCASIYFTLSYDGLLGLRECEINSLRRLACRELQLLRPVTVARRCPARLPPRIATPGARHSMVRCRCWPGWRWLHCAALRSTWLVVEGRRLGATRPLSPQLPRRARRSGIRTYGIGPAPTTSRSLC